MTSLPELAIEVLGDRGYIRRDIESIREEDSQILLDHRIREREGHWLNLCYFTNQKGFYPNI